MHRPNRLLTLPACLLLAAAPLGVVPMAALAQGKPPAAAAAAAAEPAGPQVSKPFGKNLAKANELLQKQSYQEVLDLLDKTDAMANKTPGDQFYIDYFRAQSLARLDRLAEAVPYYEKVIGSGLVPEDRLLNELGLIARVAATLKPQDWAKAADYGSRYLALKGDDRVMLEVVTIAHYQAGRPDRCEQALKYGTGALEAARVAQEKPAEGVLQIVQRCADSSGDAAGSIRYATELVRNYPKQDYWGTAATLMLRDAEKSDAKTLEVLRMVLALDLMGTAGGYIQLAQLASDAGLPGEAESAIRAGLASGTFGNPADKARGDKLLAEATAAAALDRKELPGLEAEARKAATGDSDLLVAEAFLSYGDTDKAVEAARRGIGKGVKNANDANLLLGKALFAAGQGTEAAAAFGKVTGGDYQNLAALWAILATEGAPTE
jgi:tetratricopeptide (TPR) repeat protein